MVEPLEQELVVEHLEAFRFHVSSGSRPVKHLVDLESNGALGRCSCENYTCVRGVAYAAGHRGEAVTCKHIRAAQRWYVQVTITAVRNGKPGE